MKIVNDKKLEQIIDTHKDYEIKSTVSDVFEKLSIKQTAQILQTPAKNSKKPLVLGSLIGSLTGLVIAGVSIFTVYINQTNQVSRKNISSSAEYFESTEDSKTLGKELLLFNMTKNNDNQDYRSGDLKKANIQPAGILSNNMFGHIIAGFQNIAPIIFNQISSFDSMTPVIKELKNPAIITKVAFSNCYVSTYNSLSYSYYYNTDGSTDYGVSKIGDEFYKTHIYQVSNNGKNKTEIYLEGIDNSTLFKVSQNEGTNAFTYQEFGSKEDAENGKYSFYYDVELGNGEEASNFSIKSYNKYEISYADILLNDILKILFDVDYIDVRSNLKYDFDDCWVLSGIGEFEYAIGNNSIII